jgi:hypothetical protein
MIPQPITDPDFGVRTHTSYDLEETLIKFIAQLFADAYRLDNPTLNLAQAAEEPPPTYGTTENALTGLTPQASTSGAYSFGMRIECLRTGRITGLRYWAPVTNQTPHDLTLWTAAGVQLGRATATPAGTGWAQAIFTTPVVVAEGDIVVASYDNVGGPAAPYSDTVPTSSSPKLSVVGSNWGSVGYFPNNQDTQNYFVDVLYQEEQPAEYVPYDPTGRAQTLYLKVPPRVVRGRIPRTVTGEILVDRLPDVPAIIVQATSARVFLADSHTQKAVTVRIFINAYDENPDSAGYQDCQNMAETIEMALTTAGMGALDQAYPIVLPIEWKLNENDTFPHFIAEMTTTWQLPAGRPSPDLLESMIPGERIDVGMSVLVERGDLPEVAIP